MERSGEIEDIKQSENVDTIRELYTEITEYYHSCLDTPHITYLHARGITDSSIQKFKLGYCPNSAHKLYLHPLSTESGIALHKKPFLANRITFPYWFGDRVTDIRARALEGDIPYKTCFNGTYFRGAEYPYNINDEGDTVLLTESEIKCITASQLGYAVWGLPGIKANRIVNHPNGIICFDNQRENKRDVVVAIKKWSSAFLHVKIATLPLRGEEKQDIDTYILRYGEEAFRMIIDTAVPFQIWRKYNR